MRGFAIGGAISFMLGALLGMTSVLVMTLNAEYRTAVELWQDDAAAVNLFYIVNNIQYYIEENGVEDALKIFFESGGPKLCGEIFYRGTWLSIWRNDTCDYSKLSHREIEEKSSEALYRAIDAYMREEMAPYMSYWSLNHYQVSFSTGKIKVRYVSPNRRGSDSIVTANTTSSIRLKIDLSEVVDRMLDSMAGGECREEEIEGERYRICISSVDGYNFTYAMKV